MDTMGDDQRNITRKTAKTLHDEWLLSVSWASLFKIWNPLDKRKIGVYTPMQGGTQDGPMAGKKAFDPQQVLEKAMDAFWERGYEGISIEDLVHCTGIGCGSFYGTFDDKHALYLAALDRYIASVRAQTIELQVEVSLSWRHEPHQLAHFLVGTLFSIRVLARGKQDRRVLQEVVKTVNAVFHSFFCFMCLNDYSNIIFTDRSRSLLKRILFEEVGQPTRTGSGSDPSLRREG
jgi:AcrR family transcriptional regulator